MFFLKILFILLVVRDIKSIIKLKVRNLTVLHEWNDLSFKFPSEHDREFAIKNGLYVKGNGVPIDFDIDYNKDNTVSHRSFVTVPRLSLGIPYSLAILKNHESRKNPDLFPYPNYFTHASHGADCNGITSAIRIFIDKCRRLWIIDSGQIASVQFCPPKILAFNLESNRLIYRYVIPKIQYFPGVSVFTSMIADVRETFSRLCIDTRIYIVDSWGFGLIVYHVSKNLSWRIEHYMMRPENNQQRDGIFTISLSPRIKNENPPVERTLFFHTLGSHKEIVVPLRVIDDQLRWLNNSQNSLSDFKILGSRMIQCESEAIDSFGNLYCSVLSLNALIGWNSRMAYNSDNLKMYAYNPKQIKFVTGMKVLRNSFGEDELWALSIEPKLFSGSDIKANEVKFKLIGCRISDFLSGRNCTTNAT